MPVSHRFGALHSVISLVILALALWWPAIPATAEDSCRLTSAQKMKAVKAFKALSPIFQDPRCVNCHGAVNPFVVDGGHPFYIDIVKEAQRFLNPENPGAAPIEITGPGAAGELQGIREVSESQADISDTDLIRQKARAPMQLKCRKCHVPAWDPLPMRENHFVGRSWKQICMHLKTSASTNAPDKFLGHMQDDPQVRLGFQGVRGITEGGEVEVPGAEPPAMSFNTMVKHANDWIDAMHAKFHPPAECGCEVEGLSLEIRHHLRTNPDSASSKVGYAQFDGTVVFDVQLEEVGPGWYRNDNVMVRRTVEVKHTKPSFWQCSGTGWRDELWQFSARLDERGENLRVYFGFVDEGQEASWTCTAKGHTTTDEVHIDVDSDIDQINLPLADGTVGRANVPSPEGQTDTRFISQFESVTISLIDLSPRE